MIIDDLELLPEMFKDGVRGVILLHRSKDGLTGNAQRKSVKRISRSIKHWEEIIDELRHLQLTTHPNHRIYSSVNGRSMDKSIREFKRRQLDCDYPLFRDHFYADIKNSFFSCLMNPASRVSSNFLIDCDTPEEYVKAKTTLPAEYVLYEYPTKNGMHIISRPFNPDEIKLEAKKDELMFIG
jgi:hypothetical protein